MKKSKEWGLKRRCIRADTDAMLDNLEATYKEGNPLVAYFIEAVNNGIIDAGATEMHFKLKPDDHNKDINAYLIHYDNGKGMLYSEFEEYHDIGRTTTRESRIGFAGEGIKVLHKKVEYIITESKAKRPNGTMDINASKIHRDDVEGFVRDKIKTRDRVPFETGTYGEVKLEHYKDKDGAGKKDLTESLLREAMQKWYPAILRGYYPGNIYIDGKKIEPILIDEGEKEEDEIIIEGNKIKYVFFKSNSKLPEYQQHVGIVVNGKIIEWKNYEHTKIDDQLCGYVFADYLRPAISRSKSEFQEKKKGPSIKCFHKTMQKKYSRWIAKINARIPTDLDKKIIKESEPVGRMFYKIIRHKMPKDFFRDLMDRGHRKKVLIESKKGTLPGFENPNEIYHYGKPKGPSKIKGGDAPPIGNDYDKETLIPNPDGDKVGVKKTRITRVPEIPLVPIVAPDDFRECWWQMEVDAHGKEKVSVFMNKSHPAFISANVKKASREYHFKRCYAKAIADEKRKGENEDNRTELFHLLMKECNILEREEVDI